MHVIQLHLGEETVNTYFFNPSAVHLKDDLYLVVYRTAKYAFPVPVHPWKMWWDGARLVKKYFPDRSVRGKFRDALDSAPMRVEFDDASPRLSESDVELDCTSACVARIAYDHDGRPTFARLRTASNVLQNYNHDCRVQWNGNVIKLTYNGFVTQDGVAQTCMLTRDMTYERDGITLSPERFCCDDYLARHGARVEKNWAFVSSREKDDTDASRLFLYALDGRATFLEERTGRMFHTRSEALRKLSARFGGTLTLSLGTPCVPYGRGFLCAGHAKLDHTVPARTPRAGRFLRELKAKSDMRLHGKYVYLMFFAAFDKDMTLTHLSHAFVPTADECPHAPYALVFPCGMFSNDRGVHVLYGEGDVRCKMAVFDHAEMARLLSPASRMHAGNFRFGVLDAVARATLVLHNDASALEREAYRRVLAHAVPGKPMRFGTAYDMDSADDDVDTVVLCGGNALDPYHVQCVRAMLARSHPVRVLLVGAKGPPASDASFVDVVVCEDALWALDDALGNDEASLPLAAYSPDVKVLVFLRPGPARDAACDAVRSLGRLPVVFLTDDPVRVRALLRRCSVAVTDERVVVVLSASNGVPVVKCGDAFEGLTRAIRDAECRPTPDPGAAAKTLATIAKNLSR